MTPGKTIALTRWTFVSKVMSLLFNMLSRPKQIIELENEVDYNWFRSSSLLWRQYHRLSGLNGKHLFLIGLDWKLEAQNQNADTVRFLVNTLLQVNTSCFLNIVAEMGKQWKQRQTLFFWVPKSLQMLTAAMKLKDACSLEEKLWPT